jgi:hypothetical protein
MKKLTLLALMIGVLALTAGSASAAGFAQNNGPFAVYLFDSYGFQFCDYFSLTENGVLAGGTHVLSTYCGLPDAYIGGNNNIAFGTAPYTASPDPAFNINSTADAPTYELFYLFDLKTGTWANYYSSGGVPTLANRGFYLIGSLPATRVPASTKTSFAH